MVKDTLALKKTPTKPSQPLDLPISETTWDDLLLAREKAVIVKEEMEASLAVISEEMLHRLAEEKINGKIVGGWSISKATRYSFDTDLKTAKEYGATKEVIDNSKLKELHLKGIEIPGTKKSEYVMVKEIKKSED